MSFCNHHPTATAVIVLVFVWLAKSIASLAQHRRRFSKLPGPPHHPIWGHLVSIGKVTTKLPHRVHPHAFPIHLQEAYDLGPIFYMDTHPIQTPVMIIADPETGHQVSSDPTMYKIPEYDNLLAPLAGQENMLVSEGLNWKKQRSAFNPGFSVQHIMEQVPTILAVVEKYVTALDRHAARNEIFRVEEEATKLTIDVIGKVVLDHDFKSFTTQNKFVAAMRNIQSWLPDTQSLNPFHQKHPIRPLAFKYYKRQMDRYIGDIIDERFKSRERSGASKKRNKTSIDLALETYFKENGQDIDSQNVTMDPAFRKLVIDNMLIMVFAGHDTTASTVCYIYHMLSKHPEALAKVRQEMEDIFGTGVNAAEKIRQDPYVMNKCDYTLAVMKETLRLWPPASTVRTGRKDYFIKDPVTGTMLPTDGCIVWVISATLHRSRLVWGPDANAFKPERFLPPASESIPPNAYRPFEKGPRNCIGQELALVEMKIVLALTVREFDITAAFDELDKLKDDGSIWASYAASKSGPQECYGERMYPVLMAAAKPAEGMPARIRRRNAGGAR